MHILSRRVLAICLAIILLVSVAPLMARAQETEMEATVRTMLLSDPRTSTMSEADIDAMVKLLAAQATEQGLSPEDIQFQAQNTYSTESAAPAIVDECGSMPTILCNLNKAFGFAGDAFLIPILLGLLSGILILVIGIMLERHHLHAVHMREAAAVPPPIPPAPIQ